MREFPAVLGTWVPHYRPVLAVVLALVLSGCGQSGVGPGPSPAPATCQAQVRRPGVLRGTGPGQPSGELVVQLRPGVPLVQAEELARAAGAELVKVRARARGLRVRPRAGVGLVQLSGRLQADPRVLRVEQDVRVRALQRVPDDPLYPGQWALAQVGAPAAWEVTTGEGVKVAVLDTGIAPHPDVPAPAEGYDFVQDDTDPSDPGDPDYDCTSHGTMVASVLVASTNNGRGMAGVTWGPGGVSLLVARVLDAEGNGSLLDVEEAVLWASERGARVANLSLGTEGPQPCPEGLRTAVRQALQGGTLVVAAAGNRGPQSGSVSCPANLDEVVAVAATDAEGRVASYSSRGPEVDLAAPGGSGSGSCRTDVRTASPSRASPEDYPCAAGTSFAAPHVSGAAALVLSRWPSWSPGQVRRALEGSAQDLGAPGWDEEAGCGLVRPDRALSGQGGTCR